MNSLAQILAGVGSNPYQQSSGGLSPLISQFLTNNQMAPAQLGQGTQMDPSMAPQLGQTGDPQQQQQQQGIGSMGATLPMMYGAGVLR